MNKKYIHPFELDENLYPIGFLYKEEEKIEIKMLRRNQFPSFVVGNCMNYLLNKGYINNFDCFYTGTHGWVGEINYHTLKDEKKRFFLTKEHLVSKRIANILGLLDKVGKAGNIVGATSYFNYKIGHMPLVLKLWHKEKLRNIEYSREELTKKNSHIILDNIIDLQNQFLYKGSYPWQPSTYTDKEEQKISQAIFDEMIQVDKEFLLIDNVKDSFQWLKEYDPTWIEKFMTS
jgi:hypothetical protein